MDLELVKYISTLGVGGVIAAILAVFYNKLAASHEQKWLEFSGRWEEMSADLREVVRANTVAFTRALEMLNAMNKTIDQMRWDGSERRRRTPGA